ncbi:MAG: hypothetical protein ACKOBM_03810 [Gammaproteobacteria bacterium]
MTTDSSASDAGTGPADPSEAGTLCPHLGQDHGCATPTPHPSPAESPMVVRLVLDAALGPTDALVACGTCGAHYLIEQIDCRGPERLLRVAGVAAAAVDQLLADVARGSCDLSRAGTQLHHLAASSRPLPWVLAVDMRDLRITRVLAVPPGVRLPLASWRELPCDGRWFSRLDPLAAEPA